jgi:hypothetical protein
MTQMARDKVDRSRDPGESEFGGAPDDDRLGIVADGPGPNRDLVAAYWTNADDPGSTPDPGNIGETGVQQKRNGPIKRSNQFHLAPPTYPPRYTGNF